MLPQGWWLYDSTEQVYITDLLMQVSFCPHASPVTAGRATQGSHDVQHTLLTNASGCQQTHVRFVGLK